MSKSWFKSNHSMKKRHLLHIYRYNVQRKSYRNNNISAFDEFSNPKTFLSTLVSVENIMFPNVSKTSSHVPIQSKV